MPPSETPWWQTPQPDQAIFKEEDNKPNTLSAIQSESLQLAYRLQKLKLVTEMGHNVSGMRELFQQAGNNEQHALATIIQSFEPHEYSGQHSPRGCDVAGLNFVI